MSGTAGHFRVVLYGILYEKLWQYLIDFICIWNVIPHLGFPLEGRKAGLEIEQISKFVMGAFYLPLVCILQAKQTTNQNPQTFPVQFVCWEKRKKDVSCF